MKEIPITYFGSVTDGRLKIWDKAGFEKYILQYEGKDVTIEVRRKKAKRSDQQNKFFHSWVGLLAEHTGYSSEEMKDILKYKFLRVEDINDQTGETFTYTKNTSKLNKIEFAEFCDDIQKWCMDLFKIKLPLPSENWEITFI
jgi:hypothetical protein